MELKVFKSSAGSGKTFTLVKEYLKLALKNANSTGISPVLAMTFTNKAAGEMKGRIVEYLLEITQLKTGKNSPIFNVLAEDEDLGLSGEEIVKRSGWILRQILHNYGRFAISTIDRFNHRVIRSFAGDLNLNQNFEIELEEDRMLKEAIENLIERSSTDEILSDFLIRFSLSRIEEDKSWRIEDELFGFSKFLLYENSDEYLKPLSQVSLSEMLEIHKELISQSRKFEKELKTKGEKGLELISINSLDHSDFSNGNRGGFPSYFLKVCGEKRLEEPGKRVWSAVNDRSFYSKSAPSQVKSTIDAIEEDLLAAFYDCYSYYESEKGNYSLALAMLSNFYGTALINEVYREFDSLKKRKNLLPISDFNKLIGQVVSEQEAPFIYERLGSQYQNFLVDEFQDTSKLQWKNMLPLIENSLANGSFNLVVGDGKQAIYRWRGGEVEQFVYLPYIKGAESDPLLQERIQSIANHVQEEILDTNYRSKEEIVRFNNELFDNLVEDKEGLLSKIYENHNQKSLDTKPGGYVNIEVFPSKGPGEENFLQFCVRRTIETIREVKKRGYEYSDIAILSRSNAKLIELVKAFEEDTDPIPSISSEAMLIHSSQRVRAIYSYLKLALDPSDEHEQLRLLFLLQRIHEFDAELNRLSASILAEKSQSNFKLLMASLGFNLFQTTYNNVFELLELAVSELNLSGLADEYQLAFLNVASDFFKNKSALLGEFLNYYDERKDRLSLNLPEGIDGVRMMTIHKAKGLEFPIVLFPFADYRFSFGGRIWINLGDRFKNLPFFLVARNRHLLHTEFANQMAEEERKEEMDELNVLYVATTRAVEELHVFTNDKSGSHVGRKLISALEKMKGWDEASGFERGTKSQISNSANKNLAKNQKTLSSSMSAPEADRWEYAQPDFQNEAMLVGDWVHATLALIKSKKELSFALSWSRSKSPLDDAQWAKVEETVQRIVESENCRDFFDAEIVKTEVEFVSDEGDIFRIDRLVKSQGVWKVIDYKTGDRSDKHKLQVLNYAKLVAEVYLEPVEAFLLYSDDAYLLKVE